MFLSHLSFISKLSATLIDLAGEIFTISILTVAASESAIGPFVALEEL